MRILRASDRVATPWKNGAGLTREVAVWPPGAGFEDFHWRISLAEFDQDTSFSVFAGVDRLLTLLEGQLSLSFDDGREMKRAVRFSPLPFAGEIPVTGSVTAGPVLDLNVMTRRGVVNATVKRVRMAGALRLPSSPHTRILFTRCSLRISEPLEAQLNRDDAFLLEPETPPVAVSAARGTVFLITLHSAQASTEVAHADLPGENTRR